MINYNQPYQICTRCVMDTSDPEITFDKQGLCNHCTAVLIKKNKPVYIGQNAQIEFKRIIEKIKQKGKNKKYDCLIGVSGGVDSSYLLYLAKQNGLRPLAVHMDNGWDSQIAVQNIINICKKLEIDYESYVLDWEIFKDFQVAVLKSGIVEVELPTDAAVIGSVHRVAAKYGIKFIISGSNLASEGILPDKWFYNGKDKVLLKAIQKKFGTKKVKSFPYFGLGEEFYFKFIRGVKMVYILNYIPYNKDKVMELLTQQLGWRYYGGKHHESFFTGFAQSYIQPVKFNVDYRRATYSSQIMDGTMTRDEALQLLQSKPYKEETLQQSKEYLCKKLGISVQEFETIMAQPPNSYKNYPNYEKLNNFLEKMYYKIFPKGLV